ncbi:unnamed protein product [Pleuronectes platessa]|uniref:Uncharacterized protein n=1 Tax=Pleuronectes platessa TaxID=8262 RepID=A0A9N7USA2_PLEPL|nr:unnamed protein product [Pleuronectes platessa]
MIRVRVRCSLSRDRLRDSDAGLRDPGPLRPPLLRGSALNGIVTDGKERTKLQQRSRITSTLQRAAGASACGELGKLGNSPSVSDLHQLRGSGVAPIRDALRRREERRGEKS